MKRFYETALLLIGTLGWWGFVYPELSEMTESCVQENVQEETEITVPETAEGEDWVSFVERVIRNLGSSGISNGDVRIKSRIAEYLYQEKEKESGYEEQKCAYRGVRLRPGGTYSGKGDHAPDA